MKSRAAVHLVCISWRGSKWHRSVTGGQRGCWCDCGGHKGEAVSRGLFILVHISSPMACRGSLLSGERAEIAAPRTCTLGTPPPLHLHLHLHRSGLSQRHVHLQAQTATRTPPRALTMKRDPSQWSFVSSEKKKNTGYRRSTRKQWSYWTGPTQLERDAIGFIGVGIQNEIQKCSRKSANGHQCCNYKEEVGEGVQFLWISEWDADALSTAGCLMYFECATVTLWSPMQTLEPTVL